MRRNSGLCLLTFLLVSGCGSSGTPTAAPDTKVVNSDAWPSDAELVQRAFAKQLEAHIKNLDLMVERGRIDLEPNAQAKLENLRSDAAILGVKPCLEKIANDLAPYHVGQWSAKYQRDASTLSDGENSALSKGIDILDFNVADCIHQMEEHKN